MSVLVKERLPRVLDGEHGAEVGLVLDPLRLYTDEDVQAAEAGRLAGQAFDALARAAGEHDVPIVVVQPPRASRRELLSALRERAAWHVRVRHRGPGRVQSRQARPALTIELPREDRGHRVRDPRPRQARLDCRS